VGGSAADQLSWSIRLDRDEPGTRAFDELVELVPELLAQHFPPSCGYEAYGTRLHGPIDGVRWTVTRGSFHGELGVQRYGRIGRSSRSPAAPDAGPCATLRLVASAGLSEASDPELLERRVVGWATAGWGMGSVVLGVLLASLHGLGPLWAEALLLVSVVVAWRAGVAGLVRRALPPNPEPRALTAAAAPLADGLRRWRELLPTLRAQHELLQRVAGLPPFRNPGHLEVTSVGAQARVRQGLVAASSSFTWPRAALVVTQRRQRAYSPSTGKNDA
jgi:hypothetical protein